MSPGTLIGKTDHWVYALVDSDWVEVYVGVTNDPAGRLNQHMSRPCQNLAEFLEQGGSVTMILLSHHRNRASALAEELAQIRRLAPMLNTHGMPPTEHEPLPDIGRPDWVRLIREDEARNIRRRLKAEAALSRSHRSAESYPWEEE